MSKKQALGRGLSALLPEIPAQEGPETQEKIQELDIDRIRPNPDQPRKHFDPESLAELAESIRLYGVMQPLLVVERDGSYVIVAGERRYRAAQLAGLEKVPCLLRELTEERLSELSLIENIQREDLNAIEEAEAFRALMDSYGYTQEKLAQRLGKSRPYVANTLRLLQLAPQERTLVTEGRLSAGHARALLGLTDLRQRADLTRRVLEEGLSVRQTEAAVKKLLEPPPAPTPRPQRQEKAVLTDLEKQITSTIGMKAQIQGTAQRGRLVVEYRSAEDLEALLERML